MLNKIKEIKIKLLQEEELTRHERDVTVAYIESLEDLLNDLDGNNTFGTAGWKAIFKEQNAKQNKRNKNKIHQGKELTTEEKTVIMKYMLNLEELLDDADDYDTFGSEGWKHMIN